METQLSNLAELQIKFWYFRQGSSLPFPKKNATKDAYTSNNPLENNALSERNTHIIINTPKAVLRPI